VQPKILLVTAAVLGASLFAQADEWKKQFSVSGKPEIVADVNDGHIRVSSSHESQVQVLVWTEGWEISDREVRVNARQTGNRIDIEVRVPRMTFQFGRRSLRLELVVPPEADMDLRTGDGNVEVSGVRGTQKISTGDGNIDARSLEGSINIGTGDGNIVVDGRFDLLDVHTGDGHIDADARAGSKMAFGWSLRTGDGNVRLALPAQFSANLDAHTGDGRVTVDFPVTISGSMDRDTLRAPINGGGPTLRIRTGDGQITIDKS
jgi:DUF4097 and DUF4098 domain-containing protein YvlB